MKTKRIAVALALTIAARVFGADAPAARYLVTLRVPAAEPAATAQELAHQCGGKVLPVTTTNFVAVGIETDSDGAARLKSDARVESVEQQEIAGVARDAENKPAALDTSSVATNGVALPRLSQMHAPAQRHHEAQVAAPTQPLQQATAASKPSAVKAEAKPSLRTAPNGTADWTSGVYSYDGAGNIYAIGNNYYVYDGASRLTQGTPAFDTSVAGTPHVQTFTYDQYGNMATEMTDGQPEINLAVTASSNRLASETYDAAGNITILGGTEPFVWDALNVLTQTATETYVYDADDERLATIAGTKTTYTLRGSDEKVLRELTDTVVNGQHSWNWVRDNVYRDDLLLAEVIRGADGNETTRHFHLDHLGTPRIVTNSIGARTATMVFWPYGQSCCSSGVAGSDLGDGMNPQRYTGHEYVTDTAGFDLNYMHARWQLPRKGRFLSVDPVITKASMHSPQLWNRYAYVGNNPINLVDPTGRVLQIGACAKGPSDSCTAAYNLCLSTFGNQSQEAAKHLALGKNGVVSITGMTGAGFAKQFGIMGRATNMLVSNRAAVFSLTVGRNAMTDAHKGGYCDCYSGPDKSFGVDPGMSQMLAGVLVNATETLVHETGHAVASLIPGVAFDVGQAKAKSYGMKMFDGNYEGYATPLRTCGATRS